MIEGVATPCEGIQAPPASFRQPVYLKRGAVVVATERIAAPWKYHFVVPAGDYTVTATNGWSRSVTAVADVSVVIDFDGSVCD